MTIASSNGSNRSQSPLIPDLAEAINSRPDRNTHDGREPNLHPPTEEHMEQMMEAAQDIASRCWRRPRT